jgi:deoxyribodipyrimidine photo-lyase
MIDARRPAIVWLRNDLRIHDQPALHAAANRGPILPVFVLDETASQPRPYGAAARWWLHGSLRRLAHDLEARGGQLVLRRGRTAAELKQLAESVDAQAVYFCRHYEPGAAALERDICDALDEQIETKSFAGSLLIEPDRIATSSGDPYRVFTPFWKALASMLGSVSVKRLPAKAGWWSENTESETLVSWQLEPGAPDWAVGLREVWEPGEASALERLEAFIDGPVDAYASERDRPDLDGTSRLSAHLRFGEISPRLIWEQMQAAAASGRVDEKAAWSYLRELAWREFSWHLLSHFPSLPQENFRDRFDAFPWRRDAKALRAWQRGATGYPIVDAGMRQLWQSGWMHNRVRMVVGSFLTKHLLIHWRQGEAWFWDTLVDADPANNAASWQWIAGSGADAAPYFRIFNPVIQGQKFDPNGAYVRRWVPEIARLPNRYLHAPWQASATVLASAGIELGRTYPAPIVDHAAARARALEAYASIKGS